jgi:hypothetical protein
MPENKEETKEYIVVSPILYKKKRYEVDSPVTMETMLAEPLVKTGVLKAAAQAEEKPAAKKGK